LPSHLSVSVLITLLDLTGFFSSVQITIFLKYNFLCVIFIILQSFLQFSMYPIFKCSLDFTGKRQIFDFILLFQRSAVNLENIGCLHINPLLVISSDAHQKLICLRVIFICILIPFFSKADSLVLVSYTSFIINLNSW